ncbi:hypothetical protein HZA97_06120 [Candidatus Woesearchaeota archaeon]|nr:hypothetical protein [Candidatus Woesearchaeota archaeon]
MENLEKNEKPIELSGLENCLRRESGNALLGLVVATAAMPVCAYLGSYAGEGLGWLWGNIVDFVPYVRDVAPWLAERTGLIQDAKNVVDLNENLYQTAGAVSGFWGGLWFPWKVLAKMHT